MVYGEFATDPCRSLFKRVQSMFSPGGVLPDNANVNVTRLGERFIAMTETPLPVQFDPHTLKAAGVRPYRGPRAALDRAPAPRSRERRDAQLRRQAGRPQQLPLLRGRTRTSSKPRVIASLPVQRARLHALLRAHRALARARRVPLRRQPAGAGAVRTPVHRELPLEARARHALHARGSRHRQGDHGLPDRCLLRLPPRQRLRGRRRGRRRPVRLPRTPASSRISTSTACAPASRSRPPR